MKSRTDRGPQEQSYTPALGYRWLTPFYDSAVALLTRESTWRNRLIESVNPKADDRILDVGCGTGTLAVQLKLAAPEALIVGIDPDQVVLSRANERASKHDLDIQWRQGFLGPDSVAVLGSFTKVVSSLVLHQTPLDEKRNILSCMHAVLRDSGALHIADYGIQKTRLMRTLFRCTVQLVDGVDDTQPNADGVLPELMLAAGFTDVRICSVVATVTGSITVFQARK